MAAKKATKKGKAHSKSAKTEHYGKTLGNKVAARKAPTKSVGRR